MSAYQRDVSASAVDYHFDEDENEEMATVLAVPLTRVATAKPVAAAPAVAAAAPSPSPAAASQQKLRVNGADSSSTAPLINSEEEEEAPRTGCGRFCCSRTQLEALGRSLAYLLLVISVMWTALLMGLYYLYDKYTYRSTYAFAIIWLVFVSVMALLLTLSWRRRVREEKIALDQAAEEERAAQEKLVHSVHIKQEAQKQ